MVSSDTSPEGVIEQLNECYANIVALTRSLDEQQWATQSLCPDWDTRGVIMHLVAVENMLDGWRPTSADEQLPFARIGEFIERADSMDNAELAEKCSQVFAGRSTELAGLTDEQWAQPCPTPVGPGTYREFMNIRVFDFWVHERDIATPLGRPTNDDTQAAETSLDQVHSSLGYIVGKKIGLTDGMSILFDITGGVGRQMSVVVDGRATIVEHLDNPDITVSADLVTFMQLACGRIDPAAAIEAGSISWSGDDEWGRKAASSLRFTM